MDDFSEAELQHDHEVESEEDYLTAFTNFAELLAPSFYTVGLVLILITAINFAYTMLPIRLIDSYWQQNLINALLGSTIWLLIGSLFVLTASALDPLSQIVTARTFAFRRFFKLAAFVYLIIIPLQLVPGLKILALKSTSEQVTLNQYSKAIKDIRSSNTYPEFVLAYSRIPGNAPQLPAEITTPFPEFRDLIADRVDEIAKAAGEQRDLQRNTRRQSWLLLLFKNSFLSVFSFVAFASMTLPTSQGVNLLQTCTNLLRINPLKFFSSRRRNTIKQNRVSKIDRFEDFM